MNWIKLLFPENKSGKKTLENFDQYVDKNNKAKADEIFVRNELNAIAGEKNRNVWILAAIIFLSLLGIGHSIGGIQHLRERMDNPFTKWVNLGINQKDYNTRDKLLEEWKDKKYKDSFQLESIKGYSRDFFKIENKAGNYNEYFSRSIDPSEELFNAILVDANLVAINKDLLAKVKSEKKVDWLILKSSFVKKLGFGNDVTHVKIHNTYSDSVTYIHHLPILAVVKEVPDLCEFVIPEALNQLISGVNTGFVSQENATNFKLLTDESITEANVKKEIKQENVYQIEKSSLNMNGKNYNLFDVTLDNEKDFNEIYNLQRRLVKQNAHFFNYDEYDTGNSANLKLDDPQYLAFNFSKLDKVRLFKEKLYQDYKLLISMNQIEDKENFSLVVKLTSMLSALLFLVSIIASIIFTYSLLQSYLEKNKSNLGTLKAFGLSNKLLISYYLQALSVFLLRSIIYALIGIIFYYLVANFFNLKFQIVHILIPFVIVLFFIAAMYVSKRILRKSMTMTPGDLIYSR